MTPAEVSSLIARWNPHSAASFPRETISRTFERQADDTPENIAIQLGHDRMTYRELDRRSNQLARILLRSGLKRDSLVAVCFERSLEMIVSMLAVLKAGAGYLPIDPS
jgi:non-ribosomal peptide synthetase component F